LCIGHKPLIFSPVHPSARVILPLGTSHFFLLRHPDLLSGDRLSSPVFPAHYYLLASSLHFFGFDQLLQIFKTIPYILPPPFHHIPPPPSSPTSDDVTCPCREVLSFPTKTHPYTLDSYTVWFLDFPLDARSFGGPPWSNLARPCILFCLFWTLY